jgi:SpoVK/Ycf46/Vps4 family AAA+-type ATPase
MWIGWSADRLAKVFKEAREKQPSLIFIDELDAVCPPRGAYHDSISQEFTAQLLQEIDGLLSDTQAIFLVGATNRPDQVHSAILSRFTERIEIPLPDAATRAALLKLFLRPLRFSGYRTGVIRALALATDGKSGRDLRNLVNQAVLSALNVRVFHKTSRCSKKTSHLRRKGPNGTAHLETHLSHAVDSPESLQGRRGLRGTLDRLYRALMSLKAEHGTSWQQKWPGASGRSTYSRLYELSQYSMPSYLLGKKTALAK